MPSSIVTKYGDVDRVKDDVKDLNEILSRQGASLLLDVVAESVGNVANRHKLTAEERMRLVDSLGAEFIQSLLERI